jgi:hypothetical protein
MECLEMRCISLASTVDLATSPKAQGLTLVADRQQQRQRQVVAKDAASVNVVQFSLLQIHCIGGGRFAGQPRRAST